jgi:hypothetical protein
LILGEAKTSLSRRETTRFRKIFERAAQLENFPLEKVCQVIVVHDVTPEIEEFVRE